MSTSELMVSVVIPVYNEEGALRELYKRIRAQFAQLALRAELIFIDDGSSDGSRALIKEFAAADADCRLIAFRRNCGKAAALQLGFQAARGRYVLTLDADLQDDPNEIPRFLEALQRVDLVSGWKAIRHDPPGKTLPSRLFNATVRRATGVQLHDMNCGFKGYRREVLQEITLYGELHRFIPALAAARGFTIEELVVTHHPRTTGVSKYGWERILRGFFDLLTVVYLTKYRTRPLHFLGGIGLLSFFFGIIGGLLISTYTLCLHVYPYLLLDMLDIALLACGPVFVGLGLLAEGQLAATFTQTPPPPVVEYVNFRQDDEVTHAG